MKKSQAEDQKTAIIGRPTSLSTLAWISTPTINKYPKQHIAWLAVMMRSIADAAEPVGYFLESGAA
jgi:hypothetical protein